MSDEIKQDDEFTAAAPRHPGATGTGETGFGDAEAPPAGEPKPTEEEAAVTDDAAKFLALAQRTQADFENYRKRMARENAAAVDKGVGKLAKELLPALDHLDHAPAQQFVGGKLGIDATAKLPEEGAREWPEEIAMSEEIRELVDRRWEEYGIPATMLTHADGVSVQNGSRRGLRQLIRR